MNLLITIWLLLLSLLSVTAAPVTAREDISNLAHSYLDLIFKGPNATVGNSSDLGEGWCQFYLELVEKMPRQNNTRNVNVELMFMDRKGQQKNVKYVHLPLLPRNALISLSLLYHDS